MNGQKPGKDSMVGWVLGHCGFRILVLSWGLLLAAFPSPKQRRELTSHHCTHLSFPLWPGVYYLTSKQPACYGRHFSLAVPYFQVHMNPFVWDPGGQGRKLVQVSRLGFQPQLWDELDVTSLWASVFPITIMEKKKKIHLFLYKGLLAPNSLMPLFWFFGTHHSIASRILCRWLTEIA